MKQTVPQTTTLEDSPGYVFEQFRVPRGCLGYLVADPQTRLAALVDPEVEMVEPMLDAVCARGLRPRYIVDTHTHADHFSGARDLKRRTDAKIVMHQLAPCGSVDLRVEDGDRLYLGGLALKFLHAPGHAKDLVCVQIDGSPGQVDPERRGPRRRGPRRLLTADAILIGACGRTDLPNGNATRQYHTLYYTLKSLPEDLLVYPGHDYHGRQHSTLGEEKHNNPRMNFDSEEEFVHYMDEVNPAKLDPVYQLADALKANME